MGLEGIVSKRKGSRKAFHQVSRSIVRSEDDKWVYLEPLISCPVKFQSWTRRGLMRSPSFVSFNLPA